MRSPLLAISLAGLAFNAPLAAAQEAPRVLFCSGQCTAVDQKGVRTPAPKGTRLQPGQRLETGPGSYAQLKLGEGAVGIGEQARLGLDLAGGADVVTLERGRVRVLDGETFGGKGVRPVQLRTPDGNLNLRGADIEVRGVSRAEQGEAMTLVKLNAGDARLVSLQGDVGLKTDSVQSLSGGALTARTLPITAIAPIAPAVTGRTPTATPTTIAPLTLNPPVLTIAPTFTMPSRIDPTLPAGSVPKLGNFAPPPVVTLGEAIAGLPVKTTTGETIPLTKAVTNVSVVAPTAPTTTLDTTLTKTAPITTITSTSTLKTVSTTSTPTLKTGTTLLLR